MSLLPRLLCLLLACLSCSAQAERLRVVSDDWAPYVYEHNGQPQGIQYEVASEVFKRLGVQVDWEFMPWKRCLAMVEQGQVDGVLGVFQNDARKVYMVFPDEPLSEVEFVLLGKRGQHRAVKRLEDLAGLTLGTSPGYDYGAAFNQSTLFKQEPAQTHEANLGKLMLGRIDLLVTDSRVGRYLRRQMGLGQQTEQLPLLIDRQNQYLGLARKPGREQLARSFAEELRRFKQEPAYAQMIAHFEDDLGVLPGAVEQQERSTLR
ncbi:substrate-binding periplasmic protein [Pseudomonas shirazensis]|uniref:substrate-binding periplasmic protein n=1 Tax=Pseudomonas shirazensis TaxID=2745494 RepID=UPI003CFD656E